MDRRTFLTYVGLGALVTSVLTARRSASLETQEDPGQNKTALAQSVSADFVNVKQFGPLVSGITNNPKTIAANTATIQAAIDAVGENGGGNVYIPTGQYQIAPPDLTVEVAASIVIKYDNITLVGDGIGKTILRSRGNWSLVNGQVARGMGILIKGTDNPSQPRRSITIKNLELSGGTNGFTGNRGFPANPTNGDGWDLGHKGIVLDFNKNLDNITIDSVDVHDFRGELIYAGGSGVGKVTILNTRLRNSNASMLSLDADLTVRNCEFSKTANAWVENAPISPNKFYYFYKCTFKNSIHNGLVLAQGQFPSGHKQTITNCSFYNSPSGVCTFGGVSNLLIKENVFTDCVSAFLTSEENRNIKFVNNKVIGKTKPVTTASFLGKISNVIIRNNYHKCSNNLPNIACIFYFGDLQNIVVEGNTFENCRTPEQSAELTRERPLFRTNKYINVERRELQGTANFWQSPPYIVEPKFEEIVVFNNTGGPVIGVKMSTDYYVNGQEVLIVGGAGNRQIKFPQTSSTVECQRDRYLSGSNEKLRLRFQKSNRKWYEVAYTTSST